MSQGVARASSAAVNPDSRKSLITFEGDAPKIRAGPFYLFGLLITLFALVLVPVCYIAVIAAMGYGVYFHLRYNIGVFTTQNLSARTHVMAFILGYLGPAVIGVIAIAFMLKPLFAKRDEGPDPLTLDRSQDPLLYELLDLLCDKLGAPRPRHIEVDCRPNASASLGSGMFGFLGRNLTLTIGLPLAASLDARQFVGVMAHELGHFSQRIGTRISYLIRSISNWLSRVVYERDEWDYWLIQSSKEAGTWVVVVLYLARAMVFLSRQILKLLMFAGLAISCFMLRRMEFNADRYEIAASGSSVFETTTKRIVAMNMLWPTILGELEFSWREKRLPDNLPSLVSHRLEEAAPKLAEIANESVRQERGRFFATHPSDQSRIRHAQKFNSEGIYRGEGPATALFSNFKMIAHAVSLALYRNDFGLSIEGANLVATESLVSTHKKLKKQASALARYFQHCVSASRPMGFATMANEPPSSPQAELKMLKQARAKFEAASSKYRTLYDRHRELLDRRRLLPAASAAVRAGLSIAPAQFGIKSGSKEAISAEINAVRNESEKLDVQLKPFDKLQFMRIRAALRLLVVPQIRERTKLAAEQISQLTVLQEALGRLESSQSQIQDLHEKMNALLFVVHQSEEEDVTTLPSFSGVVKTLQDGLQETLRNLWHELGNTPYPFTVAGKSVSVGQFAIDQAPNSSDLGLTLNTTSQALDRLKACHGQVLATLAEAAERVELVVGLKRLPEPPPLSQ
jgi:Zn-dependent protease with chaperone function